MRLIIIAAALCLSIGGATAQELETASPQIAPADERVAGIVAQQALINARMGVEMDQLRLTVQRLQAELIKEKARADAAKQDPPK